MSRIGSRRLAECLLAGVALGWAFGFILMKTAVDTHSVWTVLWMRFALASVLMLPFVLHRARWRQGLLGTGCLLGMLLFASFALLISGLQKTSATHTGLLTGLSVVWVPLLGRVFLGRRIGPGTLAGVVLCVLGVLVMAGSSVAPLGMGDGLVMAGAVFTALHILLMDSSSREHDAAALTLIQLSVVAVLSLAVSVPLEVVWPAQVDAQLGLVLLLAALIPTALAFWVQTRYQRQTTPTRAAMIFNLEPVFSAVLAHLLLAEALGWHVVLACLLIVGGMCATELRMAQLPLGGILARLRRGAWRVQSPHTTSTSPPSHEPPRRR